MLGQSAWGTQSWRITYGGRVSRATSGESLAPSDGVTVALESKTLRGGRTPGSIRSGDHPRSMLFVIVFIVLAFLINKRRGSGRQANGVPRPKISDETRHRKQESHDRMGLCCQPPRLGATYDSVKKGVSSSRRVLVPTPLSGYCLLDPSHLVAGTTRKEELASAGFEDPGRYSP